MLKFLITTAFLLGLSNTAYGATHEIKMLDFGDSGSMVFEPAYLYVEPGDTVRFVATTKGHNTRSYIVPKGAKSWTSKLDESFEITLQQEGIYPYFCPPHLMMGMVGVIQVGRATNLAELEQKAPRLASKIVMNSERLQQVMQQIRK